MEHLSNIPKPTTSKLPLYSKLPVTESRPIIPTRRLLRRSKSVADLKRDDVVKKPLPYVSSKILTHLPKPMTTVPAKKGTRRSMSATDLEIKPAQNGTILQSTSNVALRKRAADSVKSVVKQKMAKTAVDNKSRKENAKPVPQKLKIPPYDYKARFNALTERFDKLKELHKDCPEIKALNEKLKTDNNVMDQQLHELLDLKPKFECISKEFSILSTEHKKLTHKYDMVNSECKQLKTQCGILTNHNSELAIKLAQAEEEVSAQITRLEENDKERRYMHNLVQELKGNIRVFCRVRPALSSETYRVECQITCVGDKIGITTPKTNAYQEFTYDNVFLKDTMQFEIFEDLDQLVQSALDGYHVCVFAYGQTGSGKTYTMQGDATEDGQGMIPRTVTSLFARMESLKISGWTHQVEASILEIYNETVKDLLNPTSKLAYDIKYNEGKGVTVSNLEIRKIQTEHELQDLIKIAERNRSIAVTNYNEHSSRSHAVTKIYLTGKHKQGGSAFVGSINLVDLAGSESAKNPTSAKTINETKYINKSLAALSNVMLALHNKDSHIPYRDSKLTYLLGSCLGGNSKTIMFLNISPFEDNFGETLNSLRFAATVKQVKTNVKRNKIIKDVKKDSNMNI